MNILLASLRTIPELINGKVCVINDDGTYTMYNPSRNTSISNNFNPLDYSILVSPNYCRCIVNSTKREKESYLVQEAYKKYFVEPIYRIGDKIHIKSRRGIYEIVSIERNYIVITCNKWRQSGKANHKIYKEDFDCLAGGFYNHNY